MVRLLALLAKVSKGSGFHIRLFRGDQHAMKEDKDWDGHIIPTSEGEGETLGTMGDAQEVEGKVQLDGTKSIIWSVQVLAASQTAQTSPYWNVRIVMSIIAHGNFQVQV